MEFFKGGVRVNIQGLGQSQVIMDSGQLKKNDLTSIKNVAFDGLIVGKKIDESNKSNKFTEMVDNIDKVKVALEHNLTVENLEKYKEAVRSFLNYYTKHELMMESYFVKDSRTFMEKQVSVIKSINEKMSDLTENMLETNRGHLETLHNIGEIQGLIVNLFI